MIDRNRERKENAARRPQKRRVGKVYLQEAVLRVIRSPFLYFWKIDPFVMVIGLGEKGVLLVI